MSFWRSRTLAGAAVAVVMLLGITACGSDSDAFTGTATTSSPAVDAATDDAFAQAMAGPIEAWRTSFEAGPTTVAVPGTVVGASIGDGPVHLAANGDAVLGSQPMVGDEAFHIGSMTKLFTAALIMQLDQDGVLSLGDTIDTWFPAASNGSTVTVQMLLEHQSGLHELDMTLVGTAPNQEIVDDALSQTPIAEPGTEFLYLDVGYLILGRIAEEAADAPYADQIQEHFIVPLDLTSTYLDGSGQGPDAVAGYDLSCEGGATGTDCVGDPSTLIPAEATSEWVAAWSAGGMVSTARDQAVWMRALVAGDVLDQAHKDLMHTLTPHSSAYFSEAYRKAGTTPVQLGEGAGLETWAIPGIGNCIGHAGFIPGANSVGAYCPDKDLTIVILNNVDPAGPAPFYPGLVELTPAAFAALGG